MAYDNLKQLVLVTVDKIKRYPLASKQQMHITPVVTV